MSKCFTGSVKEIKIIITILLLTRTACRGSQSRVAALTEESREVSEVRGAAGVHLGAREGGASL